MSLWGCVGNCSSENYLARVEKIILLFPVMKQVKAMSLAVLPKVSPVGPTRYTTKLANQKSLFRPPTSPHNRTRSVRINWAFTLQVRQSGVESFATHSVTGGMYCDGTRTGGSEPSYFGASCDCTRL